MRNQVLLFSQHKHEVLSFPSAVSLHGHTRHSRESLGFIGKFLQAHRPLRAWIDSQTEHCHRATGIRLDFERAYWTPPLCEQRALELECRQIEGLGLRPIVSLSDHNTIDACTRLRQAPQSAHIPVSTEWTVPFGKSIFHLGIHNLPCATAESLMVEMRQATETADEELILALLAELSALPALLIVFNHPLWNFAGVSPERFSFDLSRFLELAGPSIHAFEINGMRSHRENRAVLALAAAHGQVVISGGDRHGCEPGALLNLTRAADFPEFADEIRHGRQSTVLIMPQYGQPLGWRFYQNFTHVIADYPAHPVGRRRWDERTFHPNLAGEPVPMIQLWRAGPPDFLLALFAAAMVPVRLPFHGFYRWLLQRDSEDLLLPRLEPQERSVPAAPPGALLERESEAWIEDCL